MFNMTYSSINTDVYWQRITNRTHKVQINDLPLQLIPTLSFALRIEGLNFLPTVTYYTPCMYSRRVQITLHTSLIIVNRTSSVWIYAQGVHKIVCSKNNLVLFLAVTNATHVKLISPFHVKVISKWAAGLMS